MSLSIRQILLVEDDVRDQELTLAALSQNRLANEVVVLGDGAQALDYLHRRGAYANRSGEAPAVILLDIKLPKVNGLEVLKDIKSTPDLALIPVVILTSSEEEKDLLQGYALGANAYVVKPLEFNEFMRAVSELGVFWAAINRPPPNPASV